MYSIYKDIAEDICSQLPFEPTSTQRTAIDEYAQYMQDDSPYSVFLLKGYAGTGKTTLLRAITQAMERRGMRIELMATTGRAAQVLSGVTERPATTIHRRIYQASTSVQETTPDDDLYELKDGSKRGTLFVVDEASMIAGDNYEPSPFGSGNLLDDLLAYAYKTERSRLIIVGDTAQLPPVGSELSDALSPEVLQDRYGMRVYQAELTEVVRQHKQSGILKQATLIRKLITKYQGRGDEVIPLTLQVGKFPDIKAIEGYDITDELSSAYGRYGREGVLVINPSNKRALEFNQGIRYNVFGAEDTLERGEQLIVARNNYFYAKRADYSDFIANGETLELRRTLRYEEIYGLHFVDARVYRPEQDTELEVKLLLSSIGDGQAQRTYAQRLELYNQLAADYQMDGAIVDVRRMIQRDPYWGAIEVKYGYAVTAHKAQGGQWPCVFIDLGLVGYLPLDHNMLRWLYTAFTRATECVYLLNTPPDLLPPPA